jgi:glutaminyl-tRNA synthetase
MEDPKAAPGYPEEPQSNSNYIQSIVLADIQKAPEGYQVHTRFPPEPNGYLHIGHAKSICLNFGTARQHQGLCNLRFDDTNPTKEEMEFVDSIQEDIKWLGFDWEDRLYYASDYFDRCYDYALGLIRQGKAYVCDLSAEEIRVHRGTLTEPGVDSPYRSRSIEENLDLFARMKNGEFTDGSRVLRAKIDMASPNMNMRDPVLYRIQTSAHHRTGERWRIYPMYDYAHPLSDALEDITHSICTLEFADHRPLYDWVLENCTYQNRTGVVPRQYEFARLNLNHTVMSKRKLRRLVEEHIVSGWDDPRMPTISGMRRRGYTPESIRDFCERIGVARRDSVVDIALLEYCLREELNVRAPRLMAVLRPLKLVITNYPEGQIEWLEAENNPEDAGAGCRTVPFSRELYIEQEDFMEDPPKKFFRLRPGGEVRLKHAYIIQCQEVVKDAAGVTQEIRCAYDPESKSGRPAAARKIKGTLHWVSAGHAVNAEVRLYDHLFLQENPDTDDFLTQLNPHSLTVLPDARLEPSILTATAQRFQFLRQGYFFYDASSTPEHLAFNRIVSLKDTWAKIKR